MRKWIVTFLDSTGAEFPVEVQAPASMPRERVVVPGAAKFRELIASGEFEPVTPTRWVSTERPNTPEDS